jgi:phenylalanyl-tRNA synthetase beta chain
MQFPESWLREFCNPALSTEQLADTLTMAGMEVEEFRPVAPPFSHVVVGEVLSIEKHPDADRLNVCQVKVSADTTLTIVCGASNVQPGIKVPCALVGAQLPATQEGAEPFHIKLGKLRGVESQGMLCSAKELKISEAADGLLVLSDDALVGNSLRDHLNLDDTLFTLKLTPNLGHCLSVYGIARELSALTGSPLLTPKITPAVTSHNSRLPVRVQAPDLCGRFSGRIIRNINAQASTPAWMVDRLARCGQRSVSPLVDISNYVMFELGRPSHIFDLDKIQGDLTIRWAKAGESLTLLNDQTVELDSAVGVIADDTAIEALAGIMGGRATAVSNTTQNIFVEAAFWWPEAIAGRARKFQFSTDASHRFERGVDSQNTVEHIERITQLIQQICGGEPSVIDDQVVQLPPVQPVQLRVARAVKVIGMAITQAQCKDVFLRLGLAVSEAPGVLSVTPPSWRFDLQIEEDLIEEVIRVLGFHTLVDTPPVAPIVPQVRLESQKSLNFLRHAAAELGYQETINFSFVEERWERDLAGNADPIRLLNPIAAPLSVMRSSLLGGLIAILKFNLAHKTSRVRIFEIGRVFQKDANAIASHQVVGGVAQPTRLGGLAYGHVNPLHWETRDRHVDFFDVKGDIEALFSSQAVVFSPADHPALHPGRSAQVEVNGVVVGHVGELHPRWRQTYELPLAPILFELNAAALVHRSIPAATAVQRMQSVWRDIAVVAQNHIKHDALIKTILSAEASLVRSARLFDVYKPGNIGVSDLAPEESSLAVRIELLDECAPLNDERVDEAIHNILQALSLQLGARLRA